MRFEMWDTLLNLLILVFWFRMWVGEDRVVAFNSYLGPLDRLSSRVLAAIRPAMGRIPDSVICALLAVFVLVLKALLVPRNAEWIVRLGFEARAVPVARIASSLAFSTLSFAVFVFKLWGISLIYVPHLHGTQFQHCTSALHHLSRPFSRFRHELKPLILLISGMLIALCINVFGGWQNVAPPILVIKLAISALAGFVDVLAIILSLLMLLIIGSWVSMFTGSQGMMIFCREWIDLILGPIRRFPMQIGTIDLAPLIFFFVIQWFVYPLLKGVLLMCYNMLP